MAAAPAAPCPAPAPKPWQLQPVQVYEMLCVGNTYAGQVWKKVLVERKQKLLEVLGA